MVAPSNGKLLYHLTHIDNIGSIIVHGLMPRARMRGLPFRDVADPEIIMKREERSELSQYIPFHFFVKTPFDCAVCANHEAGEMIIVAVWRADFKDSAFIVPQHPLGSSELHIYPYEEGFGRIDWACLDDYGSRDYRIKEIKSTAMAECLIPDIIPAEKFAFIYVADEAARSKVRSGGFLGKVEVNGWMFPGYRQE